MKEPVFDSLGNALTFAYRFSGQQFARAQNIDPTQLGSGRGLVGLDGAAQAGMILSEIRSCGLLTETILLARFADPFDRSARPCDCCGHVGVSGEFRGACVYLAEKIAMPAAATLHSRMAVELVMRYFLPKDHKRTFGSLARQFGDGEDKAKKLYYVVASALKRAESASQAKAGGALESAGIVGICEQIAA